MDVLVDIQILRVNEQKSCVKFTYKDPQTKKDINKKPELLNHFVSIRDCEKLSMFNDTTFDENQQ